MILPAKNRITSIAEIIEKLGFKKIIPNPDLRVLLIS